MIKVGMFVAAVLICIFKFGYAYNITILLLLNILKLKSMIIYYFKLHNLQFIKVTT
jgi:hypothetical protein